MFCNINILNWIAIIIRCDRKKNDEMQRYCNNCNARHNHDKICCIVNCSQVSDVGCFDYNRKDAINLREKISIDLTKQCLNFCNEHYKAIVPKLKEYYQSKKLNKN